MSTNVLQRHFTALQGGKARTAPSSLPFSLQGSKKSPSPKEERPVCLLGLAEGFKIENCHFGCLFSSIPPIPQHSERVFEMGWGVNNRLENAYGCSSADLLHRDFWTYKFLQHSSPFSHGWTSINIKSQENQIWWPMLLPAKLIWQSTALSECVEWVWTWL